MIAEGMVAGAIVVLVVWVASRRWRQDAGATRQAKWPVELRGARLVYSERLFKSADGESIVARVDRAYRLRSGALVLLELKTRKADRAYLSDVIELSAQRVALQEHTGEVVVDHAWVMVLRGAGDLGGFHRVDLMSAEGVRLLIEHRTDLLAGRTAPMFSGAAAVCRRCLHLKRCESAATSARRVRS